MRDHARIEADVEGYLEAHQQKELLRLVIIGSVDDGKSTLIGRLLYDGDGLYEDQLEAVRRASAARSGGEIDLSLITDGLKAEREQGITIDVAYRYFTTPRRKLIIADTPGHEQYTRNMATGASTADVAVILVDARLGVLPQSRRHATLAALLGIECLGVAVNKMDLKGYDRATFDAIARELGEVASTLGFREVRFFPVSARQGDNVVHGSTRMPWWEGGTLLDWLETVALPTPPESEPLRFPVQTVLRPHLDYRGFAGTVARGVLRVGDEVLALPSGRRSRVVGIDRFEGPLEAATSGEPIAVRLADELDLSRGDMLVYPDSLPTVTRHLEAMLVWFSEQPLAIGRSYHLLHTTHSTRAVVVGVEGLLDLGTQQEAPAASLTMNDIGRVRLETHRPLFLDPYRESRATGSFILIDSLTHDTVAAGMALRAVGDGPDASQGQPTEPLRRWQARRHEAGRAVLLHGPAGSGKSRLARALERLVLEQGGFVVVIDPADPASRLPPGDDVPEAVDELVRRFVDAGFLTVLALAAPREEQRSRLAAHVGEQRLETFALGPSGWSVGESGEPEAREILRRLEARGWRLLA